MRQKLALLIAAILVLTACGAVYALDSQNTDRTLVFDVYLDDTKIGYHRFEFLPQRNGRAVVSEANFDVKFLFFTAFRYRHRNSELWSGDCLAEINAETNSNGKRTMVSGERTEAGFLVDTGDGPEQLPGCVMSFAYWNPSFLEEAQLLNPQTGEFLAVDVEELAPTAVDIGGKDVPARPYRLTAQKVELTVWYSLDNEWLALESAAKGGRILRYERA